MKVRHVALVTTTIGLMCLALPPATVTATSTGRTCTWGGTPDNPTGTFTVTPGVTNLPAPSALKFVATGLLGGGCGGRMTWTGQLDAGSTCTLAHFEGTVKGLPGVARFVGKGSLDVPSVLYNASGVIVGTENAEIMTPASQSHLNDCNTPQGFMGGWPGTFSSVLHVNT